MNLSALHRPSYNTAAGHSLHSCFKLPKPVGPVRFCFLYLKGDSNLVPDLGNFRISRIMERSLEQSHRKKTGEPQRNGDQIGNMLFIRLSGCWKTTELTFRVIRKKSNLNSGSMPS